MEASGFCARIRFMIAFVLSASEVPVILAPGASMEAARPAPTGSVTAEKMIGVSVPSNADCTICAAGVAIAITASTLSDLSSAAIWFSVVASPWPLKK